MSQGQGSGLLGVTSRILRRPFAKNLVDTGVSLVRVAVLLGHKSLSTTRIYVTPPKAGLAVAIARLED
jgi:integrase/recombinase XerC